MNIIENIIASNVDKGWVKAMNDCPQDPIYHAEGDVWTHTKMVMRALPSVPDWDEMDDTEQRVLVLAALLHDVAKPKVTEVAEDGRIRSPRHSVLGARMANEILLSEQPELSNAQRFTVSRLIRHHLKPPFISESDDPDDYVIKHSHQVDTRLLHNFLYADHLGRVCENTDPILEWADYWKEMCIKNNCWGKGYEFKNSQARFLYYRGKLSSLHYEPFVNDLFDVYLMCGVAGSGKSTWIENSHPELETVSLDDIRLDLAIKSTEKQGKVINQAKEACKVLLRQRESFAFDATNIFREIREKWIDLFVSYGARVTIVFLDANREMVAERNQIRHGNEQVPDSVLLKMMNKLEVPDLTECHELVIPDLSE